MRIQYKLHTGVVKLPILNAVICFAIEYYLVSTLYILSTTSVTKQIRHTSVGMCEQF